MATSSRILVRLVPKIEINFNTSLSFYNGEANLLKAKIKD